MWNLEIIHFVKNIVAGKEQLPLPSAKNYKKTLKCICAICKSSEMQEAHGLVGISIWWASAKYRCTDPSLIERIRQMIAGEKWLSSKDPMYNRFRNLINRICKLPRLQRKFGLAGINEWWSSVKTSDRIISKEMVAKLKSMMSTSTRPKLRTKEYACASNLARRIRKNRDVERKYELDGFLRWWEFVRKRKHTYRRLQRKMVNNQLQCVKCNKWKNVEHFQKNGDVGNIRRGRKNACRDCANKQQRTRYRTNPVYRAKVRAWSVLNQSIRRSNPNNIARGIAKTRMCMKIRSEKLATMVRHDEFKYHQSEKSDVLNDIIDIVKSNYDDKIGYLSMPHTCKELLALDRVVGLDRFRTYAVERETQSYHDMRIILQRHLPWVRRYKGCINELVMSMDVDRMDIEVANLDYNGRLTQSNLDSVIRLVSNGVMTFVTFQVDGGRWGKKAIPPPVPLEVPDCEVIMHREYMGLRRRRMVTVCLKPLRLRKSTWMTMYEMIKTAQHTDKKRANIWLNSQLRRIKGGYATEAQKRLLGEIGIPRPRIDWNSRFEYLKKVIAGSEKYRHDGWVNRLMQGCAAGKMHGTAIRFRKSGFPKWLLASRTRGRCNAIPPTPTLNDHVKLYEEVRMERSASRAVVIVIEGDAASQIAASVTEILGRMNATRSEPGLPAETALPPPPNVSRLNLITAEGSVVAGDRRCSVRTLRAGIDRMEKGMRIPLNDGRWTAVDRVAFIVTELSRRRCSATDVVRAARSAGDDVHESSYFRWIKSMKIISLVEQFDDGRYVMRAAPTPVNVIPVPASGAINKWPKSVRGKS